MSLQYDQNDTAPCARNAECTGSAVALPGGPASVAETTTQPKLWPIRWNRTSRPLSLATRWRSASSVWKLVSPIVRARSFILKNERFRRMPTTGPSSEPPTPKLTSLSSSSDALVRRLGIERLAVAARRVRRAAGAEAGFAIEHPVRVGDLGRRARAAPCRPRPRRRSSRAPRGRPACRRCDRRRRRRAPPCRERGRAGARRRERHARAAAELLVAERQARPVQADEERPEPRARPGGHARGRPRTPPSPPIQRSYCLTAAGTSPIQPWLMRKTSVYGSAGERLLDPRDQAAVDAVGVVGALRARCRPRTRGSSRSDWMPPRVGSCFALRRAAHLKAKASSDRQHTVLRR